MGPSTNGKVVTAQYTCMAGLAGAYSRIQQPIGVAAVISPPTKLAASKRSCSDGSTGGALTLANSLGFLKCEVSSRSFTKGEKLPEIGHAVLTGTMQRNADKVKVYGPCLQTSGLQSDPHQIGIELEIARKKVV